MTFVNREVEQSAQKTTIKAIVRVNGVGTFAPAISTFPNASEGIGTPSIKSNPLHDWYLTLGSSPNAGQITLGVQVGTMVMWLWIGGLIMVLGTAVALVPVRRRDVVLAEPVPVPDDDEHTTAALAEVTS